MGTGDTAKVGQCPVRLAYVRQDILTGGRVEEGEWGARPLTHGLSPEAELLLSVSPGQLAVFA